MTIVIQMPSTSPVACSGRLRRLAAAWDAGVSPDDLFERFGENFRRELLLAEKAGVAFKRPLAFRANASNGKFNRP